MLVEVVVIVVVYSLEFFPPVVVFVEVRVITIHFRSPACLLLV